MNLSKFSVAIVAATIIFNFQSNACTTVIVGAKASANGRTLLWKQRDAGDYTKNVVAHVTGGKYAYTSVFKSKDIEHKSAFGGANEAGFAIINNASYNVSYSTGKTSISTGSTSAPTSSTGSTGTGALTNGKLMALALANCATVDEFERLLNGLERPRKVFANFGVADATGAAAWFEVGDSTITRFDVPEDGYLVRSNFSFSGKPEGGSGYARYHTAKYIMDHHKGKFSSEFLVDALGRSFRNEVLGEDYMGNGKNPKQRYVWDEDFIPRPSTASSCCIEVPGENEKPQSSLIWYICGYTPACYAVPVWVAAGHNIPSIISLNEEGNCLMNDYGAKALANAHNLPHDAGKKYTDLVVVKGLIDKARAAEKIEFKAGRKLDKKLHRKGYKPSVIKKFNLDIDGRFEDFIAEK